MSDEKKASACSFLSLITRHSSRLKYLRALAHYRPENVCERVAGRAPPESREDCEEYVRPDAARGRGPFDCAPDLRDLAPARHPAARREERARVDERPQQQRQHQREVDDAYERPEDYPVRPARAVPERCLV